MKRVLAALLCLLLAFSMVLMTACSGEVPADPNGGNTPSGDNGGNEGGNQGGDQGGSQGNTHVHTFKTDADWSKDATGHWYDATCDCADVTVRKLNHVDDNKDGACDVCKYSDHEHFYSEEWTADCTNHWNAAACGCIIAGDNVAAHADGDGDGVCDTCNYVIEDLHKHYYATEWSSDNAYHWHAALCEHGVEVADKAAHEINAAGYCTVCNAKVKDVDKTDFLAILSAAVANNHKVISGNVIAAETVYNSATVIGAKKTNEVYYVLGNGDSYIFYKSFNANDEFVGGDQQWYETISADEIFGVQMVAGTQDLIPAAGAAQFLNGYNYTPGALLAAGYDDTSTLAQTIYNMYDQMTTGTNVSNVAKNYDAETGIYTFSYTIFHVDAKTSGGEVYEYAVELFNVSVEFRVDDNYVINVADITVESFRNWEFDMDLSYDPETNTVTMLDSATATVYAYNVGQTSGERTYTTIYPKASFMPVDFEMSLVTDYDWGDSSELIILDEELITGTVIIEKGKYTRLHLGNPVPASALLSFMDTSDFEMTFVNKDPSKAGELWSTDDSWTLPVFSGYSNCIAFTTKDPGEYTVTIRFGQVTKTIDVIVLGEETIVVPEDTADTKYVVTTITYGWEDQYTFTAPESGTYTFTIPAGLGFWFDDEQAPRIDYNEQPNGGTVTFELAANDSVDFTVGAATKNVVWSIGVSFVAGEVEGGGEGGEGGGDIGGGEQGGIAADISGTYVSGDLTLVINNDGTMTRTQGDYTGNYTYVIDGDTVTYTLNGNDPYTKDHGMASFYGYLTFGADGMPETFVFGGTTYSLTTGEGGEGGGGEGGGDEGEPDALKDSLYLQMPAYGNYNLMFITVDGEYVVNIYGEGYDLYFTYELEELSAGSYAITVAYFARPDFESGTDMIDTIEAEVFYAQYDGVEWTFGDGEGGEGGEDQPTNIKDTLYMQMPTYGNYNLMFLTVDGEYVVNIYGEGYDLYFTYELEELSAGSYAITVAYFARPDFESGTDMIDTIEAEVFYAQYDGVEWTFGDGEGGEGGEDPIVPTEPDGTEENPYIVTDGFSMILAADYSNPIFVQVNAGVTATIDGEAAFYESASAWTPIATSVTPDVDTVYVIYSNTYAGATVQLIGGSTGGSGEGGEEPAANELVMGNNGVNGADIAYTYTATEAGTLALAVGGTGVMGGTVELSYTINGGTSTALALNATTDIPLNVGDVIVITAVATDYTTISASWTAAGGDEGGEGGDIPADITDITTLEGSGTSIDPYVITAEGQYFMAQVNDYPGQYITFTAPSDMTITLGTDVCAIYKPSWTMLANTGESCDIALAAGETMVVTICMYTGTSDVVLTVSFGGSGEGGEVDTQPDGSENNPYIITDGFSMVIPASYSTPIFVQVNAGITATIDSGAAFYASPADFTPVGKTVTPDVDTVYCIYADTGAGAMCQLTGSIGSSEVVEGSGDLDDPHNVTENNTVEYEGGTSYVFYDYTAIVGGTLTVTFNGEDFYWVYGNGVSTLVEVGTTATADIVLAAGETVYIGVTTNSGDAATITFTASFDMDAEELVIGNNSINAADVTFVYVATEDITLNLAPGASISAEVAYTYAINGGAAQILASESNVDVVLTAGDVLVVTATTEGGYATLAVSEVIVVVETPLQMGNNSIDAADVTFAYTATEDIKLNVAVGGAVMGMVEVTYSVNGGEAQVFELSTNIDFELVAGDKLVITVVAEGYSSITVTEVVEVVETPLQMGNNSIDAADVTFAYTATEDIKLNVAVGAAVMGMVEVTYTVNGGEAQVFELSTDIDFELAAGDKLVITVVAEGYSSITVTEVANAPAEPDGSLENPYVLETLPESIEITSDTINYEYFVFVADKNGTITFTWPTADSYANFVKVVNGEDDNTTLTSTAMKETFVVTVEAGATYRFGLSTFNDAGTFVIGVAFEEAQTGGGSGDSGEGIDGTYASATSSRPMTIVIDTAADTMTITRGGSSTTTYEFVYSTAFASAVDGVVAGTLKTSAGANSSVMNLTFNEDGTVKSLMWNGAIYTDFVKN